MKKQMWKLLLMWITCSLLLIACGNQEELVSENARPLLTVLVIGSNSETNCERISNAVSDSIGEALGCTIRIENAPLSDYESSVNERILSGDEPDILVINGREMLCYLESDNRLTELTALLERYPLFQEQISASWEWSSSTIEGKTFSVPFHNKSAYALAFMMRSDICDELGICAEEIKSLQDLENVLLLVKQSYPELIPAAGNYDVFAPCAFWDSTMGELDVSNVGILPWADSTGQLQLLTECENLRSWCETMYQWNCMGLIQENCTMNQEARIGLVSSGAAFGGFCRYSYSTVLNQSINSTQNITYAILGEWREDNADNTSSFAIAASSEHKELAMAFLNELYFNPELLRLCTLGQETVDYSVQQEGSIHANTDNPDRYQITLWTWPNNSLLFEDLESMVPQNTVPSLARGFWFDPTSCQVEFIRCKTLIKDYYPALISGQIPPDEGFASLEKQLLEAGAEQVLAEQQRQLDIWIASQQE